VGAGSATHFKVAAGGSATAGSAVTVTVSALDLYGNTVTNYLGTANLTSSDGAAIVPADYAFTVGDNGVHAFSVTLKTAGSATVSVADTIATSTAGNSTPIQVNPAAAATFTVVAPSTATSGSPVGVTVTALDLYGNIATGYLGTAHFTSSDGAAVLPADYTFVAGDNGVHTVSVSLKTVGKRTRGRHRHRHRGHHRYGRRH